MKEFISRLLSIFLILCMALTLLPGITWAVDGAGNDYNIPNSFEWSLTTLDGQTITNETYQGKTVMLMFYWGAYCSIASNNVEAVCESDLLNDDRVVVIAVAAGRQGEGDTYANTREKVLHFKSNAAPHCDKIIFTYDDDNRGSNLMWNYARNTLGGSSLVAGTFNVIIDSDNMIRFAWQNDRYVFPDYFAELGIIADIPNSDENDEPEVTTKPLSEDMFIVNTDNEIYNGSKKTKTILGTDDGSALFEGIDYTVSYVNNTKAGTATILIEGKDRYSGVLTYNFTIDKAVRDLTAAMNPTHLYVGGATVTINLTDNAVNDNPRYTYVSNKPSVVTVSGGTVIPVAAGNATITVNAPATANYQAGSASVNLSVTSLPDQDLRFAANSIEKTYGDPAFTNAAVNRTADGGMVSYTSSDPSVAAVDVVSGEIVLRSAGITVITATAAEVPGIWAETTTSYTLFVSPSTASTLTPSSETVTPSTSSNLNRTNQSWSNSFTDVSEREWFYNEVAYVVQKGLMNGVGNGRFNPSGTTTRGMIMTILARQDGFDTSGSNPWYQMGMEWALWEGVSDGTRPEADITREQLATMLWRYAGEPAATGDLNGYPDACDIHNWASNAMIWAVGNGIVNGSDGKLNPQGNALRSEAAAMLTRFCNNIDN